MKKIITRMLIVLGILCLGVLGADALYGSGRFAFGNQSRQEQPEEAAAQPSEQLGELLEEEDLSSYYVYSLLDEDEQQLYRELLSGMRRMEAKISLSTKDKDKVGRIFDAVLADRPELFWVSGYTVTYYTWGSYVQSIDVEPEYVMSLAERDSNQKLVEEKASLITEEAKSKGGEYEQAVFLYEYLIDMTDYDANAPNNQNIISTLLDGRSVCMGYARAYQYLAQLLDMECVTVTGVAGGESHAWNLLRMEGAYYYVDTTWGDPSFSDAAVLEKTGNINYLYLGMTTEEMDKTHTPGVWFALPACTETVCNFYRRSGLAFETFEPETIGEMIAGFHDSGEPCITFRYLNDEAYRQALAYLIGDNQIFQYCDDDSVSYRQDDLYGMITIYF